MTTAVASPPTFQALPRLGWNGGTTGGGFSAMSTEEVSRIFMPQRKGVARSNSSSSLASTTSSSSTVTTTEPSSVSNGESTAPAKKKPRGGFWPVSKAESTSGVTNTRANGSVQPPPLLSGKAPIQPALPAQNTGQQNGARAAANGAPDQSLAMLALLPMNGTFERKQINVPFYPDVLRVGRQTNAKTVPTQNNGYFDSKVLSRQHAEVWADRNGKVFIRDVKSSNGTFVNGQRLSPENRESDPHELRQHDTLELGIDIVSEDQKTIVHHKVSAKIEYVGMPGSTNNVLDLSFGDLDPSHSGALLSTPMSAPMMHSRSRPGGQVNGRSSAPSSVAGSQLSSGAQSRQMNFWGSPLNVEQLVKSLSTEMRAAKSQANELEHIGTYLHGVLAPDGSPLKEKAESHAREGSQSRQLNGKLKSLRTDHLTRFADPPAPPPSQPLPEKPDSSRSSPINPASISGLLKRSDTAKAPTNTGNPPTSPQNSQMLQLVEALSSAKKELDSQAARVRQLEDMLKEERSARADAEERARRLEHTSSFRPVTSVEEMFDMPEPTTREDIAPSSENIGEPDFDLLADPPADGRDLQKKLDHMVSEMQRLKADMDKFKRRADTAETDATKARESLAEMIERLRRENKKEVLDSAEVDSIAAVSDSDGIENIERGESSSSPGKGFGLANGHIRTPKLPPQLEQAVTTVLREGGHGNGEVLASSSPYVSMLGVVLIGVGLMAYLNSWQKRER